MFLCHGTMYIYLFEVICLRIQLLPFFSNEAATFLLFSKKLASNKSTAAAKEVETSLGFWALQSCLSAI